MATARFEVYGRVQGVGFRSYVRRQAQALELRGSVRNRDDASVEVLAAGSDAALNILEQHLRQGPLAADVKSVERGAWLLRSAQLAALQGFTILD
ncbi:MAG: acylphosphatase [Terriglobales bacterium]